MKTTHTVLALTLALVAGMFATTLISGCQKPSSRGTSGSSGVTTAGSDDVDVSIPEVGTGERATDAPPLDAPMPPTLEPKDAPKEDAAEPTAKETAPAAKPEEPKSEPVPEKPADEPAPPQPAAPEESKPAAGEVSAKAAAGPADKMANAPIKPGDWPQWGGTSYRNNTPIGKDIPIEWEVGAFDRKTGDWISENAKNRVPRVRPTRLSGWHTRFVSPDSGMGPPPSVDRLRRR